MIGAARFETLVRRLLSTKGSEASPLLSPELQPVIVVQQFDPEMYALRGDRLYNASGFQGAVATQRTWVQLQNPIGSTTLGILDVFPWQFWTNVAIDFTITLIPIAATWGAGTQAPSSRLDGRISTPAALQVYQGTSAVALPATSLQVHSGRSFGSDAMLLPLPTIVLPPGFMVMIANIAINIGANFNLKWRERSFEQSELNV